MKRILLAASISIAAAAGAVFFLYKVDLGRALNAATRGSLIADTSAGPIEYAERGDGIALLSIHGAGGGFDQGLSNATGLVGEGFRIISPSRFGYLRTPIPQDISPAAQADAHAALLSKLNVPKAIILGVSAGAPSAVELALRHPDIAAALILVVPALYSPESPVSIKEGRGNKFAFWLVNTGGDFVWWAAEKIAPSILIRFLWASKPSLVPAAPQSERERVTGIIDSVRATFAAFPGINADSTPELRELPLEKIAAPVLIVSARDDLFNTLPAAEFAAGKIPGAKLIVYDKGGHLLVGHGQDVPRTNSRIFRQSRRRPRSWQ